MILQHLNTTDSERATPSPWKYFSCINYTSPTYFSLLPLPHDYVESFLRHCHYVPHLSLISLPRSTHDMIFLSTFPFLPLGFRRRSHFVIVV